MKANRPPSEAARLKALARYQTLDPSLQSELDRLTRLAGQLGHAPAAFISLVERDRVRLLSRTGLSRTSLPRPGSFCEQAIRQKGIFIVRDSLRDARFAGCPWVKSRRPFRFYAGAPLRAREGDVLGALAILDRQPRKLTGKERSGLLALARQVMALLEPQPRRAAEQPAGRKPRPELPARRRAEEELEKSRRLLQTIYDALPDGICVADMNFTILSCNQAIRRILGYEPEELVGQSYAMLVPPEVLSDPDHLRRKKELLEKGYLEREDYFLKRKNGEVFPASYSVALIKDDQGRPTGLVGTVRDISKRKRAEAALRESEERYRTLIETSPDAVNLMDLSGRILMVNQQAVQLFRFQKMEDALGVNGFDFIAPESRDLAMKQLPQTLRAGRTRNLEYILLRADGSTFLGEINSTVLRNPVGESIGLMTVTRDITERKRAEAALRESEERYRNLVETSPDAITLTDLAGKILMVNPQALRLYRLEKIEDALGRSGFDFIAPEARAQALSDQPDTLRAGRARNQEYLLLRADGSTFLGEINTTVLRNEAGEPIGLMAVTRDITERRQAEAALRESEERYRTLVETSPDAITLTDLAGKILMVNPQALRHYGTSRMKDLIGRSAFELIAPQDRARAAKNLQKTLETGQTRSLEYQLVRQDGSLYPAELNASVLRNAAGQPIGFIGVTRDITERKRLEEARRESERFLANIFTCIQDGISILDTDFNIIRVNPAHEKWYAYAQPLVGKKCYEAYHSRQAPCEICPSQRSLQTGEAAYEVMPWRGPDGEITGWFDLYSFPLFDPVRNTITGVIEYVRDITERKRLEAQVQHAQKLESLGILAGGIAHDFNNLLVSILGHAGLAQMRLLPDSPALPNLLQIETAARRAAELTQQMLAYSGRGTFLVQPLDLSRLVEEMAHLLEVAISKKVTLTYQFASDLPAIEADATQLRQVVLNLITNASEAVGEASGAITICTGVMPADPAYLSETYLDDNLPAGWYVYLEVSDSGCGMDRETQKRIFDPFFSTKFTGRGLGLATVLGIVRGHKGAVKVYSEPGRGTTFKVLFPCSEQPAREVETEVLSVDGWRGQGSVLVVDDEETVRLVTRAMLEEFGFSVLLAAGGQEGIEIFRQHANEIVAVLLDMTMPDLSGEQTYQEIMRLKPQARIILTSGYNELEAARRFAGQGLAGFIQKPYQALSLIQKLREILRA